MGSNSACASWRSAVDDPPPKQDDGRKLAGDLDGSCQAPDLTLCIAPRLTAPTRQPVETNRHQRYTAPETCTDSKATGLAPMTAAAPTAAGCATAITDAAALAEVAASLVKGRNHVIDGGSELPPLTGIPRRTSNEILRPPPGQG